jgi:hypothetical protein
MLYYRMTYRIEMPAWALLRAASSALSEGGVMVQNSLVEGASSTHCTAYFNYKGS